MAQELKPLQDWLLVANGLPLSSEKLSRLAQNRRIMALDGAYDYVTKSGLKIDVLLGDFDSIAPSDLVHARKTLPYVVDAPNQNKTDLEKGLDYLNSVKANDILICAGVGLRLQHALYNLRLLKKYHQTNPNLVLVSETEIIRYFENTEIIISGKINDDIALLGFPSASITTSGLKYDVTDYDMDFEKGNSICNALTKEQATVKITGGALVIHEITC